MCFIDTYTERFDRGEDPETVATDLVADVLRWFAANSDPEDREASFDHITEWGRIHAQEELA